MGHVVVDYRRVSFVLSGVAGPTNMREEVWWWEGNMRPKERKFQYHRRHTIITRYFFLSVNATLISTRSILTPPVVPRSIDNNTCKRRPPLTLKTIVIRYYS